MKTDSPESEKNPLRIAPTHCTAKHFGCTLGQGRCTKSAGHTSFHHCSACGRVY